MVHVDDEDFERLLLKIAQLEKERDLANGIIASVEYDKKKRVLTEGQLTELSDVKSRLEFPGEAEAFAADDGADIEANGDESDVSPASKSCTPVDALVSEVEKFSTWWKSSWTTLVATGYDDMASAGSMTARLLDGHPSPGIPDPLRDELVERAQECQRLRGEMDTQAARLRGEQALRERQVAKAREDRDEARSSARDALKRVAVLQSSLEEVQERCQMAEKEMISARSERAALAGEVSALKDSLAKAAADAGLWRTHFISERDRRRETHEQLQQLRGNIRVMCRIRPMLPAPASGAGAAGKDGKDGKGGVRAERACEQSPSASVPLPGLIRLDTGRRVADFEFNACFDGRSTQEDVFAELSPF